MDNFIYSKELKQKTYTTVKKSLIITGAEGTGKTAYLKWHSFREQYERSKKNKKSLKEQIKNEGYLSFYVDMTDISEQKIEMTEWEKNLKNIKTRTTDEGETLSVMYYYRQRLIEEINDFLSIIEQQEGMDTELRHRFGWVLAPLTRSEYILEDPIIGDVLRSFLTEYMPDRFLNLLTYVGELLAELLGLEKEKILFAIDGGSCIYEKAGWQEFLGYWIRHCGKSSCKNITIRAASRYECDDIYMLYPYYSCESQYKNYKLCPEDNKEKRKEYIDYMKSIVMQKLGDDTEIPDEFCYYSYPNVNTLLEYVDDWNKENKETRNIEQYLREKAFSYIQSRKKDNDKIDNFLEQVNAARESNDFKQVFGVHVILQNSKRRREILDLKKDGILLQVGHWIKRNYLFHPVVYPYFNVYLEEIMEKDSIEYVDVTLC